MGLISDGGRGIELLVSCDSLGATHLGDSIDKTKKSPRLISIVGLDPFSRHDKVARKEAISGNNFPDQTHSEALVDELGNCLSIRNLLASCGQSSIPSDEMTCPLTCVGDLKHVREVDLT